MSPSYEREMGELSARVGAMETDLKDMKIDVRTIRDEIVGAKGGWRAVVLIAGISGTLTAAAMKFLPFLFSFPK